jgi:hypothetical protein
MMHKMSQFQVFKLRFSLNNKGQSLINLCAMYETIDILKALIEYFRECYLSLLINTNKDVKNGAPGQFLDDK